MKLRCSKCSSTCVQICGRKVACAECGHRGVLSREQARRAAALASPAALSSPASSSRPRRSPKPGLQLTRRAGQGFEVSCGGQVVHVVVDAIGPSTARLRIVASMDVRLRRDEA